MDKAIPARAKGVYTYLDYLALAFMLAATEEFVRGSSWRSGVACLAMGFLLLTLALRGAPMKAILTGRLTLVGVGLALLSAGAVGFYLR